MIARYLTRRAIGTLIRLGRTLRGQERPNTPKTHNRPVRGDSRPAQAHTGGRIMKFTDWDRDECAVAGHEWRWHKHGLRVVHDCICCGARYVEEIDYEEE